jgi:ppGpp synthetase/RelA/SpoT-type nucleotidyltranferase
MIIIERNISTKEKQNVIDLRRLLGKNYDELPEMQTIYNRAMENIIEKLESIDHNFYKLYNRNSIHHIESRLKTPESIFNKLKRKGYEPSIKKAKEVLTDIAGIRVICHFKDDIYTVADMLCSQKTLRIFSSYCLGYRRRFGQEDEDVGLPRVPSLRLAAVGGRSIGPSTGG